MLKRCWNYVSIIIFLILLAFRIYSWVRNGAIGSEAPGVVILIIYFTAATLFSFHPHAVSSLYKTILCKELSPKKLRSYGLAINGMQAGAIYFLLFFEWLDSLPKQHFL